MYNMIYMLFFNKPENVIKEVPLYREKDLYRALKTGKYLLVEFHFVANSKDIGNGFSIQWL